MSRSYLLADALAAMKNAMAVKKENVTIPYSTLVANILGIMKNENYITDFEKVDEGRNKTSLNVKLKYNGKKSAIMDMELVSKPSRRVYLCKEDIPQVLRGRGLAIVSTSKGVVTDKQAKEAGMGGELLFKVW